MRGNRADTATNRERSLCLTSSQQFSGSWSKTYTGDEAKDLTMLSVTGDIMGDNNQQVSCKVIVDGQEKVSKDASGSAGAATCNVPLF